MALPSTNYRFCSFLDKDGNIHVAFYNPALEGKKLDIPGCREYQNSHRCLTDILVDKYTTPEGYTNICYDFRYCGFYSKMYGNGSEYIVLYGNSSDYSHNWSCEYMSARLGLEIEKRLKCKCVILDVDTMTVYSPSNYYFNKPFEEFIEEMKEEYNNNQKILKIIDDIEELHKEL